MNIKYLSIISSMGGILILYVISIYAQIPVVSIENIDDYDGKIVTINGTVLENTNTKFGNQLITIGQNNSSIIIFISDPIKIQIGDIIQATGTVQQYKNDWELSIDKPEQLKIIQTWSNNTIAFSDIAENPSQYLNQNLNVTGYVDLIFDNYFQLIDEDNNYSCIVEKPYIKNLSLYTGQKINLKAFFTYDPTQTRYIFSFLSDQHTIIPCKE